MADTVRGIGHCIICHQDNVPMSDEHVIPKSIGGCYHVYNVCDDCNKNRFGVHVDPLLVDHPMIQLFRWQKKLKGHYGSYPHPFAKPDGSTDGSKYGVNDKNGTLEPFLYPRIDIERDEKGQLKQLRLEIDIDEADKADGIIKKRLDREGIDLSKIRYNKTVTKEETSPVLHYRWEMDLHDFNLDLLKMAYEFTCDSIKNYENDPIARHIADILYNYDPKRLDELKMTNHKMDDWIDNVFGDYIDFSSDDRHYLFLICREERAACIVRLFNKICTGFVMSESKDVSFWYSRVLINDTTKHEYANFTLKKLIEDISGPAEISFEFDRKRYKGGLNLKKIPCGQEYFYHDSRGEVLLFNEERMPIANVAEYTERMQEQRIAGGVASGYQTTYYFPTERLYVMLEGEKEFVPIERIVSRSRVRKY